MTVRQASLILSQKKQATGEILSIKFTDGSDSTCSLFVHQVGNRVKLSKVPVLGSLIESHIELVEQMKPAINWLKYQRVEQIYPANTESECSKLTLQSRLEYLAFYASVSESHPVASLAYL